MIRAVLFDLDGTLADTAPDLGAALNCLRIEEGLPPMPLSELRAFTSQGVRGLLRAGMNMLPENSAYAGFAERVLTHYQRDICRHSRLFDGIPELLGVLDARGIQWGVVTNKHARFTTPLVNALGLARRACCVVSGDTAARPKPAPDPLLYACSLSGHAPADCLYVGDDRRDIEAGHAAGMAAVAVRWGYLGVDDPIENWGADHIIEKAAELLDCLVPPAYN